MFSSRVSRRSVLSSKSFARVSYSLNNATRRYIYLPNFSPSHNSYCVRCHNIMYFILRVILQRRRRIRFVIMLLSIMQTSSGLRHLCWARTYTENRFFSAIIKYPRGTACKLTNRLIEMFVFTVRNVQYDHSAKSTCV